MKINWFKNRKTNNFTSEVEKLRTYLIFLTKNVEHLFNTQEDIEAEIKHIEIKTKQRLKKEQLAKELWVLRYAALYVSFFDLKIPKNQIEVKENIALINRAFESVLKNKGKSDYLPWLKQGFIEYAGMNKLDFSNLEKFKSNFVEKVAEKISSIAFNCTDGRLGGELHDFVIELLMTTVAQDKKIFEADNRTITTDEIGNIKGVIGELKITREKTGKEFFENLLGKDYDI